MNALEEEREGGWREGWGEGGGGEGKRKKREKKDRSKTLMQEQLWSCHPSTRPSFDLETAL